MDNEWDLEPPESTEPQPEKVYTGEIVTARPLFEEHEDRRRDAPRYDEETIAEAIRAVVAGFPLSQVAERVGCAKVTVWRWYTGAIKDREIANNPSAVSNARAKIALELETAREEAWKIIRNYPGTKIALEALVQINNLIRNQAVLQGLNAPTVVHVDTPAANETDLELQEMITEARAKSFGEIERLEREFNQRGGPKP